MAKDGPMLNRGTLKLLEALERSDYQVITVDTGEETINVSRKALIKVLKAHRVLIRPGNSGEGDVVKPR